jgi:hypothetical protein
MHSLSKQFFESSSSRRTRFGGGGGGEGKECHGYGSSMNGYKLYPFIKAFYIYILYCIIAIPLNYYI